MNRRTSLEILRYLANIAWRGECVLTVDPSPVSSSEVLARIVGMVLTDSGADVLVCGNVVEFKIPVLGLSNLGNPLAVIQSGVAVVLNDERSAKVILRYTAARVLIPGAIVILLAAQFAGILVVVLVAAEVGIISLVRWSAVRQIQRDIREVLSEQ